MKKHGIEIVCLLKNTIVMIVWMAFAYAFNKWWIALFSILFLSTVKNKNRHYLSCDVCGRHSEYANSHNEAADKAKSSGWIRKYEYGKMVDYCPKCAHNNCEGMNNMFERNENGKLRFDENDFEIVIADAIESIEPDNMDDLTRMVKRMVEAIQQVAWEYCINHKDIGEWEDVCYLTNTY